ncbi:MAG: hypothetical protein HUU20_20190 [Pirellulales bacterium]|nr:hypothetical protein [Pirellulales bacterium]
MAAVVVAALGSSLAFAQDSGSPAGLSSEQELPDRHSYVVQDALRFCHPRKGFWVDLGAGKGQMAVLLVEATGNPVVMLDPNRQSLAASPSRIHEEMGRRGRPEPIPGVG